jgi:hypothetical protein
MAAGGSVDQFERKSPQKCATIYVRCAFFVNFLQTYLTSERWFHLKALPDFVTNRQVRAFVGILTISLRLFKL